MTVKIGIILGKIIFHIAYGSTDTSTNLISKLGGLILFQYRYRYWNKVILSRFFLFQNRKITHIGTVSNGFLQKRIQILKSVLVLVYDKHWPELILF